MVARTDSWRSSGLLKCLLMLVRIQTPYIEASTLRLLFLPLRCRSRSTKNCTGRTETACSQKRKAACRKYCPCLKSSGRAKTKYRPDSCDFADQHSQYGQIRQKAGRREENAWYQAEGAFSGVSLVLFPSLTPCLFSSIHRKRRSMRRQVLHWLS